MIERYNQMSEEAEQELEHMLHRLAPREKWQANE